MKQIRVVLFHTGVDSSKAYADQINESLTDEAAVVDIHDPRPVRLALPIRATPNVAILLFADTLEEGQELVDVLRQLDYFKREEEAEATVGTLLAEGYAAGTVDGTTVTDNLWLLPAYKPEGPNGDYNHPLNETCVYNGQPWRCCQGYNAQNNPDIIPGSAPAHWVQYHTKDPARALPFGHPTGAHDTYMLDEAMVYTDGLVYISTMDNNAYSPDEYARGWKKWEGEA